MGQLAREEKREMMPFERYPVCSGTLVEKDVEKLLRRGNHTAAVKVRADVCLHCGERLYSQETVRRVEDIRAKLERQAMGEFERTGFSFWVG
jgi:YgiT-type zinc finger domain-containing protein